MCQKVRVYFEHLNPGEGFRSGEAKNSTRYSKLKKSRKDRGATVNARRSTGELCFFEPLQMVWRIH
jgi:hypothetical protein